LKEKAVEEMIFKSRSTSPLMRAVRETFDKFDMGRQAELRIFCGEEKNLEEKFKEENTKGEKINEEAFLPVARSLLLTSSPLLRSLLSSYPASNTISLPDASPIKVSEVLKLLGSKWEEVLIDNQHIDILKRLRKSLKQTKLRNNLPSPRCHMKRVAMCQVARCLKTD